MHTRRSVLVGLVVLAGCMGDPGDAWIGTYDVSLREVQMDCGGSAPRDVTSDNTWRIERDASGVFIAGMCRLPLVISTASYATFRRTTCTGTTSTGIPLTLTVTAGSLHLDGDTLNGDQSYEADVGGRCVTGHADVVGIRR